MNSTLVFTFIGADRPGLIERLADVVGQHGGNWLESRMVQLAGQFAGIARVELATDKVDSLSTALNALGSSGLVVHLQPGSHSQTNVPETLALHVLGPDRQGIVREISRALVQRNINVREMSSNVTSAPMSGEPLFEAHITIEVPQRAELDDLFDQLDDIAEKLDIDIAAVS